MRLYNWDYARRVIDIPRRETMRGAGGTIYVVKLQVMPGFSLLKIGATSGDARDYRLKNYKREQVKLVAVSPWHLNYYENEEILHRHFDKYRVPKKPNSRNSRPELFNVGMAYFFENLPTLVYALNPEDCRMEYNPHYKTPFYFATEK